MTISLRAWLQARAWLIALCWAAGLLGWTNWTRLQHVELATRTAEEPVRFDTTSPTGHPGGTRELIIPGHNYESYNWITQTQQMLARGDGRVCHIDYENAPFGRAVDAASPYRWWLGLLAEVDHGMTGRPLGAAVEQGALYSDPLLQLLLLVAGTLFVRWRFGMRPAAFFAVGLAGIFPWGGAFLPGVPNDHGLAQATGLASVLILLAGVPIGLETAKTVQQAVNQAKSVRWCFLAAGLAGGFGLWLDVSTELPILFGLGVAALLLTLLTRFNPASASGGPPLVLPWRLWAMGGALACFAAYLAEYFPGHLGSWQLRAVHPVYSLAWLGAGEVLTQTGMIFQQGPRPVWRRHLGMLGLGLLALAALPVAVWRFSPAGFLSADFFSHRLTNLPGGVEATSLAAWLVRDGFSLQAWATLLPWLLVVPAGWLLARRGQAGWAGRARVILALGPVLAATVCACSQLRWWNGLDALLLALLVVISCTLPAGPIRWGWAGFWLLAVGLGLSQTLPSSSMQSSKAFAPAQIEGLIDRDLAQWLARWTETPGAVILATPNQTAALHYYGGFRGLASFSLENSEGFGAAVRIASATTPEEAQELIQRRQVKYLILPSWDDGMDGYARLGLGQMEGSFIQRLHLWDLPSWLRPVAYQMPDISGFEDRSVVVLEVVDGQSDPAAMSRLAEYFVEMGDLGRAAAQAQMLKRFPADLGSVVARLDVELAVGVTPEFAETFASLLGRLARKADRIMPWDRRVSLAVLLARGKRMDLAREQVSRCLSQVDADKLRSLTTGSLYRLQVLAKAFGLRIDDPQLHQLALDLLPADLRNRL